MRGHSVGTQRRSGCLEARGGWSGAQSQWLQVRGDEVLGAPTGAGMRIGL